MHKYRKLVAWPKKDAVLALQNFKQVVISEKIDGANASVKLDVGFMLDQKTKQVRAFSRNTELKGYDGLSGFRKWVIQNVDKKWLIPGVQYYGEWLVSHKVKYREDAYEKFYLYDLYYEIDEKYYSCYNEVGTLFVENTEDAFFAPVIFAGEMPNLLDENNEVSIALLKPYMRTSFLGAEKPEGIVIKDYNYFDRFGNNVAVKIVNDEFKETRTTKTKSAVKAFTDAENIMLDEINSCVTENAVEKMIMKLQDIGKLDDEWKELPLSTLIPIVMPKVKEDVIEENFDVRALKSNQEMEKFFNKQISTRIVTVLKQLYFKQ